MKQFSVGDRVVHRLHGPGLVVFTKKTKNLTKFSVCVKFDSGYERDNVGFYIASVSNLTSETHYNLENK